ncbi:RdgB/HAM1 family non-canonical purine NTP pyrophosphatase [Clostridium sp. 19966]|uniref:RdgB/HAM1 family non-canonical purine NTP pyrophosphatase n=1 Tax=Clostridium sp. 19966 TaxID=2768166 RepID=UPI0028DF1EA3|nr:RdgB/HAM1 family non-canonical purine NTP pyrophosphatase [Clostridium sp. 19966]MDT8715394.1 RdgB/HAM1 family non-canonical purine NTP pyrophosphatase [Clostridium sp. 19966]
MKKLLVATNNEHKLIEIKEILKDIDIEIVGLNEAGIDIEIDETGTTFRENAYLKAKGIFDFLKDKKNQYIVMSDDSGIAVDALNGAPGVFSARFDGEHGNSKKNNEKLLTLMKSVPYEKRTAKFICSIVLVEDEGDIIYVDGEVEGIVTEKECGIGGFGYDPIFFVPQFNKTFGELNSDEKNSISHRGRALEKARVELIKIGYAKK